MLDGVDKTLLAGLVVLVGCVALPHPTRAAPPVSIRGLSVPTALTFYDRARKLSTSLEKSNRGDGDENGDSNRDEPRSRSLEAVDTVVVDPGHGDDASGAIGVTGVAEKYLNLELAYDLRERLQRRYPGLRVVLTRYWDQKVPLEERSTMANRLDADLFISLHYNAAGHERAVGIETYYLETRKATPGYELDRGEESKEDVDEGADDAESDDSSSSETKTDSETRTDSETKTDDPGSGEETGERAADTSDEEVVSAIRRDLRRGRTHRWSGWFAETLQSRLMNHLDTVDRGVKQANFAVLRGTKMPAVVVEGGFMSHPKEGRRILEATHRQKLAESISEAISAYDARRSEVSGPD